MLPIQFATYPRIKCSPYFEFSLVLVMPDGPRRMAPRHFIEYLRDGKAELQPGTLKLKEKPPILKLGAFR